MRPVGWRHVVGLTALLLGCLVLYAVGVLLPYHVNDLAALPLHELASGAHDPKDMWPQGLAGGLVQLAGLLALGLTPIAAISVPLVCLALLWAARHQRGAPVPGGLVISLLALVAVCGVVLVLLFSPTGAALATWRLD